MANFSMTQRVMNLRKHSQGSISGKNNFIKTTTPLIEIWGEWTPDPSTIPTGQSFTQTRTSNLGGTETRPATGTLTETPTSYVCGSRLITDQNIINLLNNSTQVRYQYNSYEGSLDITIPWSSSTVYASTDRVSSQYPFVHLGLSWNSSTNTLYYDSYDEALVALLILIPIGANTSNCLDNLHPENPVGGTTLYINGTPYVCAQGCALPFTINATTVSLTFS